MVYTGYTGYTGLYWFILVYNRLLGILPQTFTATLTYIIHPSFFFMVNVFLSRQNGYWVYISKWVYRLPNDSSTPTDIESNIGSTMTKTGPLAATARDAALAYAVMAQPLPGHFFERMYGGGGVSLPVPHLKV